MSEFYLKDKEEVLKELGRGAQGLTSKEAETMTKAKRLQ